MPHTAMFIGDLLSTSNIIRKFFSGLYKIYFIQQPDTNDTYPTMNSVAAICWQGNNLNISVNLHHKLIIPIIFSQKDYVDILVQKGNTLHHFLTIFIICVQAESYEF